MKRSPWMNPVSVGMGIFAAGFGSGIFSMMPTTAQPSNRPSNNPQQQPLGPPPGCPAPPGAPCPDGKAIGPFLEKLVNQLKLTDKQEDKIDDIFDAEDAARAAVLKKYDPSQQRQIRREMQAIDAKTRAAIEAVLTKDQSAKLAALEKEGCKNCPPPPCPPPPGKNPPPPGKNPPSEPSGTPTPSGGYS